MVAFSFLKPDQRFQEQETATKMTRKDITA